MDSVPAALRRRRLARNTVTPLQHECSKLNYDPISINSTLLHHLFCLPISFGLSEFTSPFEN